jgi:hypothetical protein
MDPASVTPARSPAWASRAAGRARPGSRETGTGYEKAVTVLGKYPGSETVERMRQECGVEFVVNDRFLVKVTGQWVEMPAIYEMAGKIPFDRFAKME